MHIYPSFPNADSLMQSEDSAVINIETGFQGYRVRKPLTSHQQSRGALQGSDSLNSVLLSERRGMAQNQSTVRMEITSLVQTPQLREEQCDEMENVSVANQSATKIQASVRGFLVRKQQKAATDAAAKIQAVFRGFQVRKNAQKIKPK